MPAQRGFEKPATLELDWSLTVIRTKLEARSMAWEVAGVISVLTSEPSLGASLLCVFSRRRSPAYSLSWAFLTPCIHSILSCPCFRLFLGVSRDLVSFHPEVLMLYSRWRCCHSFADSVTHNFISSFPSLFSYLGSGCFEPGNLIKPTVSW